MLKNWKFITIALVFIFLIIQFIPVDKNNPPTIGEITPPLEVKSILQRSCYDCHSHQTVWPWYSRIAPVSWLIAHDVKEGRDHLNFSTWSAYNQRQQLKLYEEIQEVIEKNEMPLKSYLWIHPSAKLTNADKRILKAWLSTTPSAN